MKRSILLLGSMAFCAVTGGVIMNNFTNTPDRTYTAEKLSKENEKNAAWNDAASYYHLLYADPQTGEIDAGFYQNAYQNALAINQNKAGGFSFAEEGPDNVGGRTRGIIVDVNNDNVVYAGGVDGGLFKSTDGGNWWSKIESWDEAISGIGTVSISSIAMTNNGTLYVGTGGSSYEGGMNGEGSGVQEGEGVWYSEDDGVTWNLLTGTSGDDVNKVVADLSKTDVIYTTGTGGLKRFVNKAEDLTLGSGVTGTTGDVKVSSDGNHVLVSTFSKVFVSGDAGSTFTQVTGTAPTNIPNGGARMECAISYEKNNGGNWSMWVAQATSSGTMRGVFYSENNGVDWYEIAPSSTAGWQPCISASGQCGYDMVIDGVPGYPNDCIFGGIDSYRWSKTPGTDASDGDGQWSQLSFWAYPHAHPQYVHADIHRFTWNSAGQLYIGSDGGISISSDNQTQFFSVSNKGYNVTQFFAMSYGPDGAVMGGTQDNGTQYNDHSGASWLEFKEVLGGDGFECEISYMNPNAMIGSLYYADISRSDDKGNGWQNVSPPCPSGTVGQSCGNFYTALRLFEDPNDQNTQDSIEFIPDSSMYIGDEVTYYSESFNLELNWTLTEDLIVDYDTTFITSDTVLPNFDTLFVGDTLLTNGIPRNTIMLPDTKQSIFVVEGEDGVYLTRDMLRFGNTVEWWNVSNMKQVQSFGFSRRDEGGNWLWIGNQNGVLQRLGGLDSCYNAASCVIDSAGNPDYMAELITIDASELNNKSNVITNIAVDPDNADLVLVTMGGQNGEVFLSENATSANPTFDPLTGLPGGPIFAGEFIQNNDSDTIIMIGTEYGVYSSTNEGAWVSHNEEIGLVPVFDIRQQWRDWNDGVFNPYAIYLGTHGRGIWKSNDVLSIGDEPAVSIIKEEISGVNVYPNPLHDLGNIEFELANQGEVSIEIFDLQGKRVKSLNYDFLNRGKHIVPVITNEFKAGTYLVLIKSGKVKEITKFIKY